MGHYLGCYPNLCTPSCNSLIPNKYFCLIIVSWQFEADSILNDSKANSDSDAQENRFQNRNVKLKTKKGAINFHYYQSNEVTASMKAGGLAYL